MRRLRSGLLAAAVVFVTSFSLVGTSSSAWAYDSSCVGGSWFCGEGRDSVFDGTGLGLDDFKKTWDDMNGWGAPQPEPGCSKERPYKIEGVCAPLVQGYATGPGGAVRTLGIGTASEVKSGVALSARLCATGSACRSVLQWFGRSLDDITAGPKALDVAPGDADISTGKTVDFGPGQFYPATNNTAGPWGHIVGVWDGNTYATTKDNVGIDSGDSVCMNVQGLIDGVYNMTVTWRSSLVNRSTGEWVHLGGGFPFTARGDRLVGVCIDPSSSNRNASQYELRSFDIVGDKPLSGGELSESDTGFAWGQRFVPDEARNRVTLRCQAADGTETSVVGEATLVTLHAVVTPSCPPGSKPLWAQLDLMLPDGSVQPQSIENLRPLDPKTRTADAAPYPTCADGSCIWIIKVGGTWCAKGVQGCTDWASHKDDAKCFFGPYEVPLTRCGWLERAYETTASPIPATGPNLDGNPDTHEGPTPVRDPSPSASPAPGPTRTAKPNPQPSASASSSPSATSSTGPTPSPSGTPGSSGNPDPADTAGSRCWPNGWGIFNPAGWILKPLNCAFVPRDGYLGSQVGRLSTPLDKVGIYRWRFVLVGMGSAWTPPDDTGCRGPRVDTSRIAHMMQGNDFPDAIYPFDACSGVKRTVAETSNVLLSGAILFFGGWRIVRVVSKPLGYDLDLDKKGSDK